MSESQTTTDTGIVPPNPEKFNAIITYPQLQMLGDYAKNNNLTEFQASLKTITEEKHKRELPYLKITSLLAIIVIIIIFCFVVDLFTKIFYFSGGISKWNTTIFIVGLLILFLIIFDLGKTNGKYCF